MKNLTTMKNLTLIFLMLFTCSVISQTTYVPDDNFEQALIDLGYDSAPLDNFVLTATISGITLLNLNNENITDLTGLEDFTALIDLNVSNNLGLISIDLSSNTQLENLLIGNTSITSLNLNNNVNLISLNITTTPLTEIDLSTNVNLEILQSIEVYGMTSLDLSACVNFRRLWHSDGNLSNLILPEIDTIEWLILSNNNLTSVDFVPDTNTVLELLILDNNQITEADLSSKGLLFWIRLNNNDGLTSIDIRNTEVTVMYADQNPDLTCIFVDDANWASSYPEYAIDSTTAFVETEAECDALLSTNNVDYKGISLKIYPNPVQEQFSILSNTCIKGVKIYNAIGKLVKQYNNEQDFYNVSSLTKAIYFVSIKSEKGITTKKLIIE